MKITKKQLKRIVQEEIGRAMFEGGMKGHYEPFEGADNPANPDAEDIRNETQKLAKEAGISFEEADAMVKKETAEMEAKRRKGRPLGEQSTLLNEDFGEIIFAVFANLFAELGFNVATHKSHHSGGSGGSGGSSDPDIDPTGDKVLDSNYAWQWSDDFLRALKLGKLSPEQLKKLEYGAEMNWRDDGDMLANYKQSKDRAAMQSRERVPKRIKERKITKKQLKRIIQEEIGRVREWE